MTVPRSFFSWISSWLSSRWILLLISFGLAVLVWTLVNSGKVVKESRYLKLQYGQLPGNLVFHRIPLSEIRLDLLGPLRQIRSLHNDELFYTVDLSSVRPGINRIEIETDLIKRPFDVDIVGITPRSFNVHLEEKTSRQVPVRVVFAGKPAEGYSMNRYRLNPERLVVKGPLSVLNRLKDLNVEVSLAHRESSFSETMTPRIDSSDLEVEGTVTVEVEISSNRRQRAWSDIEVITENTSRKLRLSPSRAKVSLEGSDEELKGIEPNLKVIVAVNGLSRGRYRLRGRVDLPSGLKLLSIEPSTFLVDIQ